MKGKCIYCLKDKELTEEHIIPESIGGSLFRTSVCKSCNSHIGHEIDAKFVNSILMQLPRRVLGIAGKTGKIPNPFSSLGVTPEKIRMKLDDDFKPYIIPAIEEEVLADGSVRIKMLLDLKDSQHLDAILTKKFKRIMKLWYPHEDDKAISKKVIDHIERVKEHLTFGKSSPFIKYPLTINLGAIRLEFIKIAYETAFLIFGYEYIENSLTANLMRDAIMKLDAQAPIRGETPILDDDFKNIFTDIKKHHISFLDACCYVKLFNLSGAVICDNDHGKFRLDNQEALVYEFDAENRSYRKAKLTEFLTSLLFMTS